MWVYYTFIVSLFFWPWFFMDLRGLFCIVDLRPLSLSSSLFADDFLWAMIFLRNAWFSWCDILWQPIFSLWVCVFLSCAISCIVIDQRTFFCRWASIAVGFCAMIFCDMLFFFWPSLGLCWSLLRSIMAWLYRFWRLFMLWRHSRCGFWIIILFVVLPFFKCNIIAYALHLRGVLRSISIGLGL
jgi:hypothetical protein